MRVLLIMPPMTIHRQSVKRCLIPMGLAYIAAILENNGAQVSILDAMVEGYENEALDGDYITYGLSDEEIMKKIRLFKPNVIGISCIFSSQLFNILRMARLSKEVSPKVKTVVGGLHPTFFPNEFLSSMDVDYIIMSEGEYRFLNFLDILSKGSSLMDFEGIAFRDRNGSIIIYSPQSKIENLDELPFPARHLLKMEKYIDVNISLSPFPRKKRVAEVLTSRGCPNRCIFCASSNFWGHNFRGRSVDNVINEMKFLKDTYGIEEIQFSDDNLTYDRDRMKELCRKLIPLKLSWCTPNGVSVNTLDEDMIDLMKQAGCYQITFSVESASHRVLKKIMHKSVDLERLPKLVEKAHKVGISSHATFVMGFPNETLEEIEADFNLAYKLMFDSVSFFVVAPLPGSKLYTQCKEKGLLSNYDIRDLDYKRTILNLNYISADKLQEMIDQRMQKYNQHLLIKHPVRFFKKYGKFLIKNPLQVWKIFGRVT